MINKVTLIGRLTRDIELKKTATGLSVASFTLAVDKVVNGEHEADFIPCVAWKGIADTLSRYTHKGSLIAISGRINSRTYTNREKKNITVIEVNVQEMQLLEKKNNQQSQANNYFNPYASNGTPEPNLNDTYIEEAPEVNPDLSSGISYDDLPF